MKKIKLPQELAQLGDALSHEEMQEIHICGEQGSSEPICKCEIYLAGKGSIKSKSSTKTAEKCKVECEYRCSTYEDCYKYIYFWNCSDCGSGSMCGSDCNCGSDYPCGSGSGGFIDDI